MNPTAQNQKEEPAQKAGSSDYFTKMAAPAGLLVALDKDFPTIHVFLQYPIGYTMGTQKHTAYFKSFHVFIIIFLSPA